jgi:hypothetical protein
MAFAENWFTARSFSELQRSRSRSLGTQDSDLHQPLRPIDGSSQKTTYWAVLNRAIMSSERRKEVQQIAEYIEWNSPSVEYLSNDTCCINKEDPAEIDRSIASMFNWYQDAQGYLPYLSDVSDDEIFTNANRDLHAFALSSCFTRGWTLPRLLVPRIVVFLTECWRVIAHKKTLNDRSRENLYGPQLHDQIF